MADDQRPDEHDDLNASPPDERRDDADAFADSPFAEELFAEALAAVESARSASADVGQHGEHGDHGEHGERAAGGDDPLGLAAADPPGGVAIADGEPSDDTSATSDAEPETPGSPGTTVLVIEDETPIANLLREMLEDRGCRVVVAEDGQEGLDAFAAERPSAVFCDLLLPRRDGFHLLADFEAAAPHVPVIVMTGVYRADSYRERLAHARLFLTKPFDDEELRQAVELAATSRNESHADESEPDLEALRAATKARDPWISTTVLPLPRVLESLRRERSTGLLTHRAGERQTVFELVDGSVRFVRGNDPSLRLGRILAQMGTVDEDALEAARESLATRTTRARLGEVLLEVGAIDEDTLHDALQLQIRRLVADAFGATGGETLFRAQELPDDEDVVLDADPREVVIAGCATWRDEERTVLAHLPAPSTRVELGVDPEDPELRLTPALVRLIEAVREPTPLSQVLGMAELIGLRARPVVYGLLCAGVLRPVVVQGVATGHEPSRRARPQVIPPGVLPLRAILDLEEQRATGTLSVRLDEATCWIAFRDGTPCAAGSSDARTRIGQRLVDAGLVTPEQLEVALDAQRRRGDQPLGRFLIEQGALEPAALLAAVRSQVVAIARDLVLLPEWPAAVFETGRLPANDPLPIGTSASEIVLEALRLFDPKSLERLAGTLAPRRPELKLDELSSQRFPLSETEELVRAGLPRKSEAVLRALASEDESDPDVLRLTVLALLLTEPEREPAAA